MAAPLVTDQVWGIIAPLLPAPKPRRFRYPGRKRIDNRRALTGIVFVLKTGIGWEDLPLEMGCGSGMTCWRRLQEWQAAGVWQHVWAVILTQLQAADQLDWSRGVVDSAPLRALKGGAQTGPNPTDKAKAGSKHHILTEAHGIPLAAILTKANTNDITQLEPLLAAIPPVRGKPGHPRHHPDRLYADRGYDSDPHRQRLRRRGIQPRLARRRTAHGSGLGVYRWVVERTLAWLHQFKRLRIRYERRTDIHEAFLYLGCILICVRFL